MATSVIATSLSLHPRVWAQASSNITASEDAGRRIYVNDFVETAPARRVSASSGPGNSLVYWSTTEQRWKPVPKANLRAARSAAAEVSYAALRSGTGRASQSDVEAAIERAASRHNVDANLVRAVIKVESNFNPNAVSRKGAMGLMQLMPQTARQLNVTNPFDPEQNVDAGVRHLKTLMQSFGGDVKLTLAAYNAGAGAVARSAGIPRYTETRNYVRRITELYYGGSVPSGWNSGVQVLSSPLRDPVRVSRDARGILYISNTD
ncbi:MAG: lytic transglycosylase domain-containing protein [Acidobacteria bacterium]|nr:lytic transglycosylase domain-containing protein [Acidobacteriota bacterium]